MDERKLGYVTIAFISLIFIAFFASQINTPIMEVNKITGMETASPGGESPGGGIGTVCWKDDSNGELTYEWYKKLAKASVEATSIRTDIDQALKDDGWPDLKTLMDGIKSQDDADNVVKIINKVLEDNGGINKFKFDWSDCKISCEPVLKEEEKFSSYNCVTQFGTQAEFNSGQAVSVSTTKKNYWVGRVDHPLTEMMKTGTKSILFGEVTKNTINQRIGQDLGILVANKKAMQDVCGCKQVRLGCCMESVGRFSLGNKGPLQAEWDSESDPNHAQVCPQPPNTWMEGVSPSKDPNKPGIV